MRNLPPYKVCFSSSIRCLVDEEKKGFLATASLENLQKIIPNYLFDEGYEDLLPIAGNMAVAGLNNKNGHGITCETGTKIYKSLKNKFLNLEHKRDRLIGHIVEATLSKFTIDHELASNSELLTEEAALESKAFNLSYAAVIYALLNEDLAEKIIESSNPSSDVYREISSSWEIGFTDFDIAIGSNVIKEAEIVSRTDEKKFLELEKHLKSNGGTGKKEGENVYRVLKGGVILLGGGLTTNPAGAVRGLVVGDSSKETEEQEKAKESPIVQNIITEEKKNQEDKAILNNLSVTHNNDKNLNKKIMPKITKIQDITDEQLKEAKASDITTFVNDELQKAAEDFLKKENVHKELEAKHKDLVAKYDGLEAKATKLESDLNAIKEQNLQKEQAEKFNQRLSYFDETYELSDETRKVLVAEIKNVSDEIFAAISEKYKVLLKPFDKKTLKAQRDEVEKLEKEKTEKESKLKEDKASDKETITDVLDKVDAKVDLLNVSEAAKTLKDKAAKAFGRDQWEIGVVKKNK